MELCRWYVEHYVKGCGECEITDEETACCGDMGRCECKRLRQAELHAEAIDLQADADREEGKL